MAPPQKPPILKKSGLIFDKLPENIGITVIRNKAGSNGKPLGICHVNQPTLIRLSAKTGQGVDALRKPQKSVWVFRQPSEGGFMARRRHLDAPERAAEHLHIGQQQLEGYMAGEILAEELRIAQQHLTKLPVSSALMICLAESSPHSVSGSKVGK